MPKSQKFRSASAFLPEERTLETLRAAAAHCQGCDLYLRGTQTVFGEGAKHAQVIFVGEQPGDKEDLTGHVFVGPAGKILDKAMEEAGIDRRKTYVTNAVKHFKWEPRGKRRIHKKPSALEIAACRPWFNAEVEAVRPRIIVCLGATAAQAILGRDFRVTQRRGELIRMPNLPLVIATVHPSAILRAQTDEDRHREMSKFVEDLKTVAAVLHQKKAA